MADQFSSCVKFSTLLAQHRHLLDSCVAVWYYSETDEPSSSDQQAEPSLDLTVSAVLILYIVLFC